MKFFRISIKALLCIIVMAILALIALTKIHEDSTRFNDKYVSAEAPNIGDLSVRFMGNTNLLFSDGQTSVLIDGWFSRPNLWSVALGRVEPDLTAITDGLRLGEIESLAAVIPVHSHYDHAMDSPEVARRTGAQLLGSVSTANIAKGWGLAEDQIELVQPHKPYFYGDFKITLLPSEHFEFPSASMREAALSDIHINEPLTPPAKATDYKMGGAYTVYIEHPKGNALVQGSAGFTPNALNALDADVVFLGIGGLNSQTHSYQQAYWQHVVKAVSPKMVYPVHWDSLTDSLEDKPVMPNLLISKTLGFSSAESLDLVFDTAAKDNINVGLLPMWQPVRLFD